MYASAKATQAEVVPFFCEERPCEVAEGHAEPDEGGGEGERSTDEDNYSEGHNCVSKYSFVSCQWLVRGAIFQLKQGGRIARGHAVLCHGFAEVCVANPELLKSIACDLLTDK